jgi:CheY-like chemotaxis protein
MSIFTSIEMQGIGAFCKLNYYGRFRSQKKSYKEDSLDQQKSKRNIEMKKQILIVEDDLILSLQLEMQIRLMGYDIAGKVNNAPDAVKVIKKSNPDLVLMDIFLAGEMDGVDAITMIREFSDVPVLYLTGNADEQTRKRAHASRPVAYIVKPVDMLLLKKTIYEILAY